MTLAEFLSPVVCEAHGIARAERLAVVTALAEDYRRTDPCTPRARILYMRRVELFLLGFRAGAAQ